MTEDTINITIPALVLKIAHEAAFTFARIETVLIIRIYRRINFCVVQFFLGTNSIDAATN